VPTTRSGFLDPVILLGTDERTRQAPKADERARRGDPRDVGPRTCVVSSQWFTWKARAPLEHVRLELARMRDSRKEVIQPHLPVRLPCYDFVPIADPTFDGSLP
jgi:hypothetical protein